MFGLKRQVSFMKIVVVLRHCLWRIKLKSYSILIALKFMSRCEYFEQLDQASSVLRYLE